MPLDLGIDRASAYHRISLHSRRGYRRAYDEDSDLESIRFTQREINLLLKYGYPFEEIEAKLRACKDLERTHMIKISEFDIEHLIGDLVS